MGRNFLVADGGSTKCAWAGCGLSFNTTGVNPIQLTEDKIIDIWRSEFGKVATTEAQSPFDRIDTVFYYGSGCTGGEVNQKIANAISKLTGIKNIHVESDMLGAARAILGDNPGVACILGTGCNSCLYDGERITDNVRPLGYVIGDEGSGADIGKRIVADALKGILPHDLQDNFFRFAGEDYADIIKHIYSEPRANAYLANFTHFAAENINRPEIKSILHDRFDAFIKRNIMLYPKEVVRNHGIGFVGSIAVHFSDILKDVCAENGIDKVTITANPIEGMLSYHNSLS